MKRIVLAYSGGLATTVAIPWLGATYGAEVVTVTLDLGQARALTDVRERALAAGALRAHVIDAREEFVRDYLMPALRAGAACDTRQAMGSALARPLIARRLVDLARMEGAAVVAHGCRGTGHQRARLELPIRALGPALDVVAPACTWSMSQGDEVEYLQSRGMLLPERLDGAYDRANLWGRIIGFDVPEGPWREPPEDLYTLTRAPEDCPDEPAYVEIDIDRGIPVRANGIDMPLLELIESLGTIAGVHGVGRSDQMVNQPAGPQMRTICEAPAAAVLHSAHHELTRLVIDRDLERLAHDLSRTYADLACNGLWFSPARQAIDGFFDAMQPRVSGSIRLKLFKGHCRVVGRRSPFAQGDATPAGHEVERSV